MNSKNSKISEPHVLILKLTDELDLRRGENCITLSDLSIYNTWKNIKAHTITINLKYQHQRGMINLNCLMIVFCIRYSRLFSIQFKKAWRKY